jgi:hypothetical protein
MAAAFSLLTAIFYLASVRAGRQLRSGYFWIGFPTRSNGFFKIGVFGSRSFFGRDHVSGFGLLDFLWDRQNKGMFFIDHFELPQDIGMEPLAGDPVVDGDPNPPDLPNVMQSAALLLSVIYPSTHHARN